MTTGSGVIPLPEDDDEDDGVPGRSWLRLAGVVGACTLLLLAIIVAFNLGRGRSPLGSLPEAEQSQSTPSGTTSSEAAAPLTGLTATDLDPQGDPPEENPDLAPLVVDGDPATSWRTETYLQNFGPGGLKTGAGLTLDLGGEKQVSDGRPDPGRGADRREHLRVRQGTHGRRGSQARSRPRRSTTHGDGSPWPTRPPAGSWSCG